jgi:hypothetical protein
MMAVMKKIQKRHMVNKLILICLGIFLFQLTNYAQDTIVKKGYATWYCGNLIFFPLKCHKEFYFKQSELNFNQTQDSFFLALANNLDSIVRNDGLLIKLENRDDLDESLKKIYVLPVTLTCVKNKLLSDLNKGKIKDSFTIKGKIHQISIKNDIYYPINWSVASTQN